MVLLPVSYLDPDLFNKAPYKNVIVLGHVQDENGQKMSKSKGNAVDPFDALQTYGADAIRWYFYINSAPWLPNRFHGKPLSRDRDVSWVLSGIPMHSLYSMRILIILTQPNIRWNTINFRLWTNGTAI